ncbi:MAG: tRNA (uridine(34)/cytosine(34)/5-carboxymethylaminomethyluridine(34)-2'-O)-methyltransferase TrmL [Candidatus Aminicenantes bacterium]|nr:tRNA (uridine(34)/cytosine(34)/5-carboxymethylaminomethyluridine(34)-2'-O)-methyltransferase TrmL [Candidatus Aminicenantes bacterium]NIM80627.1 tRNA (uridine(34)/cytosine(34)/5-carboxymethylaminomethyluridine(34)-2'-O)-methyltransferase TrmL [Candidatus Aminicenantes bacterium]NIN20008.1 tRNA (uridine(34)/cytosine(34)/5-carboxymethylaminomethyluridine(34)-2'-O)-methyltransferase TrmL [Candidatus Aminicenantes bacterium]NIN47986.1 tRNA (uridine(34)/cytosine(34)/5-carboxymethylaminomethyluridi
MEAAKSRRKKEQNKTDFSAEVVLVEPEIPQNTGNIVRTCAALGCPLHLIEPLGFSLEDRYLRRAGLDYWHLVEITCYPNIDTFFNTNRDGTFYFLTRKGQRSYHEIDFRGHIYFIFGKETAGLPNTLLAKHPGNCLRIPMQAEARSLNLSNTVALVLYEAFRQNHFPGLKR